MLGIGKVSEVYVLMGQWFPFRKGFRNGNHAVNICFGCHKFLCPALVSPTIGTDFANGRLIPSESYTTCHNLSSLYTNNSDCIRRLELAVPHYSFCQAVLSKFLDNIFDKHEAHISNLGSD